MANNRLRGNFLSGLIEDNPLLVGATTLTSARLASLPVVANGDYMPLILDPSGAGGSPEIVWVTAHTANATTATISRAQEGTGARQHAQNVGWINGPTTTDFRGINNDRVWNRGTAAHALDDEFNDGVLDPAWLRYDLNANGTVWNEGADVLSSYVPSADTADRMAHILAKPLGGLTFPLYIETSLRHFRRYATNHQMWGLCMVDGLAAANRGIWKMPYAGTGTASASTLSTRTWTALGTGAGTTMGADTSWEWPGGPLYQRLRWTAANTFESWYSADGVTWLRIPDQAIAFTLTPTHVGFCHSNWGQNQRIVGTAEYFRVVQA